MQFTSFVMLQIRLLWSVTIVVGYDEQESKLAHTIINISSIVKIKMCLTTHCEVAWYCMWGTQLIAYCFISWNLTYLLFFAPEEFQVVKTTTFTLASHCQLLMLLLLIILQIFKSQVSSIFTIHLHATQYLLPNNKWQYIVYYVFREGQYQLT
jgi:hypothetical protein